MRRETVASKRTLWGPRAGATNLGTRRTGNNMAWPAPSTASRHSDRIGSEAQVPPSARGNLVPRTSPRVCCPRPALGSLAEEEVPSLRARWAEFCKLDDAPAFVGTAGPLTLGPLEPRRVILEQESTNALQQPTIAGQGPSTRASPRWGHRLDRTLTVSRPIPLPYCSGRRQREDSREASQYAELTWIGTIDSRVPVRPSAQQTLL